MSSPDDDEELKRFWEGAGGARSDHSGDVKQDEIRNEGDGDCRTTQCRVGSIDKESSATCGVEWIDAHTAGVQAVTTRNQFGRQEPVEDTP